MRRALLFVLAAAPSFAVAQSSAPAVGTIDRLPAVMNLAQCAGTTADPNRVPRLDDEANLSLTWNVKLIPDKAFTPTTGVFKVYASRTQFQAANKDSPWSCHQDVNGASISPTVIGPQAGYEAPAQVMGTARTIPFRDIATAAQVAPTCEPGTSTTPVYLCVEWLPTTGGDPSGWATGTINYDPTVPAAPTGVTLAAGDGRLTVTSCTEGQNNTAFIARAVGGAQPQWSEQGSSCKGLEIKGLTNGQVYDVSVFAMNAANNPSAASPVAQGTPIPTSDFWDHYDGAEQGGCNTGAGTAGLFAAISLIAAAAAARRRKP